MPTLHTLWHWQLQKQTVSADRILQSCMQSAAPSLVHCLSGEQTTPSGAAAGCVPEEAVRMGGEKVLLPAWPSCPLPSPLSLPDSCRTGPGGAFTKGDGCAVWPGPAAVRVARKAVWPFDI